MSKNVLQSSNSSKKQRTLGFQRPPTTTSASGTMRTAPTASSVRPVAESMRSMGTSSSISTIATAGGKENNVHECLGPIDLSISDVEDMSDEEDDREPAAALHRTTNAGQGIDNRKPAAIPAALPTFGSRMSNEDEDREPPATYYSGRPSSSTAGHRTTPASNASRPSATTNNRTQSLLSPPATPVMKDQLEHGDLHPADARQI